MAKPMSRDGIARSAAEAPRRGLPALWAATLSAGLSGCATPPSPPAPEPPARAVPAPAPDPRVAAAEALQLRAAAAEAEQRWLDAVTLREALRLLQPHDPAAQAASARAAQQREAAVAEGLTRARTALRDGDTAAAQRQYLQVLAWWPGHPAAVQALQILERQRAERLPRRFVPDPTLRLPSTR
ncbi:MAG: hypothetical protein ACOVQT_08810 [Rubrivivax sp.]